MWPGCGWWEAASGEERMPRGWQAETMPRVWGGSGSRVGGVLVLSAPRARCAFSNCQHSTAGGSVVLWLALFTLKAAGLDVDMDEEEEETSLVRARLGRREAKTKQGLLTVRGADSWSHCNSTSGHARRPVGRLQVPRNSRHRGVTSSRSWSAQSVDDRGSREWAGASMHTTVRGRV